MSLEITEENFNFSEIVENCDLSFNVKAKLAKSKIILLPESFSNSYQRGNFSSDSPDLLKFIRRTNPEFETGVFENIGEEKFEEKNALIIVLPSIYINIHNFINVPDTEAIKIVIELIAAYIFDKWRNIPNQENAPIETEIFFEDLDNQKTMKIKYSGSVAGLKSVEEIVDTLRK